MPLERGHSIESPESGAENASGRVSFSDLEGEDVDAMF